MYNSLYVQGFLVSMIIPQTFVIPKPANKKKDSIAT